MYNITFQTQTYGRKLRQLRLSRCISQMQLEIAADLSVGSISRMENNHINPTKETLFKIAGVLQLTSEEAVELFCIKENLTGSSPVHMPVKYH
jgi:transcriptional regulator with XRE-family HTH domain